MGRASNGALSSGGCSHCGLALVFSGSEYIGVSVVLFDLPIEFSAASSMPAILENVFLG